MPCLLLRRGRVCRPGVDGPEPARAPDGGPIDPFDVIERLTHDYSYLYVVDLDGIERQEPQLDYLQEFSREISLWVDGGIRTSDQAIDILVAGAQRAVVSSSLLPDARELRRAWKLSAELVFEIPFVQGQLVVQPGWEVTDPVALSRLVRATGPVDIVVSPRDSDPDWSIVRAVATGGPTWVDGTFRPDEASRLDGSGAVGGIFHLEDIGEGPTPAPAPAPLSSAARDDED
jgi:hypothetical protein